MGEALKQLAGRRILIVEDEWLIADDLVRALVEEGAHVVGPAASASHAAHLLATCCVDGAVLDILLAAGGNVYSVAETLQRRGVPFMFATGYDDRSVRRDFAHVPRLIKPYELCSVCRTLLDATVHRA